MEQQSYLGLLAAVKGGALANDPGAFWTQSEIYRCASGNQQLAHSLRALLVGDNVTSVKTSTPVTALEITSSEVTLGTGTGSFQADYAVLAIPQPTWKQLQISPAIPDSYLISTGPAVKYLSPLTNRFWLTDGRAPSGSSDELGMTWEGTDNQMVIDDQGIELTTFAGGPWAEMALSAPDKVAYFTPRLETMFRGYEQHLAAPAVFVPWPEEKWTQCGYSCPAPGEVISAAPLLAGLHEGRMAFAGEHTVMAMSGYMEGALQSGLLAAGRILEAAERHHAR
jgi:monoamine oxidase